MKLFNKLLVVFLSLIVVFSVAGPATFAGLNYQQWSDSKGANLIEEFDKLLAEGGQSAKNILNSEVYLDLQALRMMDEKRESNDPSSNVIMPLSSYFFGNEHESVDALENEFRQYKHQLKSDILIDQFQSALPFPSPTVSLSQILGTTNPLKIFPSTTAAGNIVGGEFPAKHWALTFDDGPSKVHTPQVLKNLLDAGIPATFFTIASVLQANPTEGLRTIEAGMEAANHSMSHKNLPQVSDATLQVEITEALLLQERILGRRAEFFRLPYGAGVNSARIRSLIAEQNLIHVFWNVDTLDWKDKNPASIVSRALSQMRNQGRGVILFHDIHDQSVVASKQIMQELANPDNQWKAGTMSQWVDLVNETP